MMDKYKRYRQKCRSEGKCPHCGKTTDINHETGKPFFYCKERRKYKNNSQKSMVGIMSDAYIRNNLQLTIEDHPSKELLDLKREHLKLFRISRKGKRYEKYV